MRHGRSVRNGAQPRAIATARCILYGWHSVKAALENPARKFHRLLATENALHRLREDGIALPVEPELVRPETIAALVGPDAVHQGLLAEADPLPSPDIDDLTPEGIILVLDQITDPHNVGAILRSAAAFGVDRGGHDAAPQPGSDRRAGQGRLRRARIRADRRPCPISRARSTR